ncbi:hypothetical protein EJ03DRAFT_51679 [Teratosphaeria nubilosa]|uniref:Uncharacterized protein n=1 Tax=Teratosphaeria nubilosa TaxID=161662 RepID=A0A6G1LEC8_9PEZI|nr:hypothetical protein EJ03DRAFT_51679 [Teratosphaeria nubilosa]
MVEPCRRSHKKLHVACDEKSGSGSSILCKGAIVACLRWDSHAQTNVATGSLGCRCPYSSISPRSSVAQLAQVEGLEPPKAPSLPYPPRSSLSRHSFARHRSGAWATNRIWAEHTFLSHMHLPELASCTDVSSEDNFSRDPACFLSTQSDQHRSRSPSVPDINLGQWLTT